MFILAYLVPSPIRICSVVIGCVSSIVKWFCNGLTGSALFETGAGAVEVLAMAGAGLRDARIISQ